MSFTFWPGLTPLGYGTSSGRASVSRFPSAWPRSLITSPPLVGSGPTRTGASGLRLQGLPHSQPQRLQPLRQPGGFLISPLQVNRRHEVLYAFAVGSWVEYAAPAGVSGRQPAFEVRRAERAGLGDQVPGRVPHQFPRPATNPAADRQRIVSSEGSFFRHRMTSLNVYGNRQRPRG